MGFSLYASGLLVKQFFNAVTFAWPTTLYVGLFTVQPSGGAGGTECSYSGYARLQVNPTTANWSINASNVASNVSQLNFAVNGGSSITVVGYGLFDALTAGNLWNDVAAGTAQVIATGVNPYIPVGALTVKYLVAP